MCETKVCALCKLSKSVTEFYFWSTREHHKSICKECTKLKSKIYRERVYNDPKRKEHEKEVRIKWRKKNLVSQMFNGASQRALKNNLEFTIEKSDIIIPDICPVLGIPIRAAEKRHTDNSPSLDRIDSSKGYVKGNVCVISWRANLLKKDGTSEEHIKIAEYMDRMLKK